MDAVIDWLALPIPFWLYATICGLLMLGLAATIVVGWEDFADVGELAGQVVAVLLTPLFVLLLLWGGAGVINFIF